MWEDEKKVALIALKDLEKADDRMDKQVNGQL